MEWISVKDRLPKPNTKVLIAQKDKDYSALGYLVVPRIKRKGRWVLAKTIKYWICCVAMLTPAIVTHWMPLPEPPKE